MHKVKFSNGFFRLRWLKDISIAKKLYFIVGAMAVLIILELFTLWFAIHTLSSVRAFVGAEGLWSKAQKDAVYQLRKYDVTHNESDFQEYKKFLEVPLGDHKTRVELLKQQPDIGITNIVRFRINTAVTGKCMQVSGLYVKANSVGFDPS